MHREAYEYVSTVANGRTFRRVIEFGSLDINGSVRGLFAGARYHGIDLQPGPGVDEIADAATWPRWQEQAADVVVCCEVLEHAENVPGIVRMAYRCLREGGEFIVTCATGAREPHSARDGGALREYEHYANVDPGDLVAECIAAGFIVRDVITRAGEDLYLLAEKPTYVRETAA